MGKWYSKKEKLEMLKQVENLGCNTAGKLLNISRENIKRWRKQLRILGEEGLTPGKGIQSKNKRQGQPKTLNLNEMTKEELIKYIEVMEDLKKYLERSTKGKYQAIFQLQTKNPINYLCKLLKISKSGYYKWLNNGMKQFNKWNSFIANAIKTTFYTFKEIYGYNMISYWLKKIYKLEIKPHIVYRYMKNMSLKSKVRIKKFDYRLKSGNLRYDNLLNRDFTTTGLNQKLGTDISYLLSNGKTYYLSIIKDFHNNEILDFKISSSLDMTFVIQNVIQSWINAGKPRTWILQSDQGFHYTNPSYKTLCDELGIKISMSRRGNSCDNGPTESWFGTMKTEFLYQIPRKNRNIEWIKENLPKYIYFYNNYRPQPKLKGMSPIEYRLTCCKTNTKFISTNLNWIK